MIKKIHKKGQILITLFKVQKIARLVYCEKYYYGTVLKN